MSLPILYTIRSVQARWVPNLVAIVSVAGAVAVFVSMLALASGFQATLVASGSVQNALVLRAGSTAEVESALTIEEVRVIQDAPGIARDEQGPVLSPEALVIVARPLRQTGTDANVQLRGVSPRVWAVRPHVRIVAGRAFTPGLAEVIVGKHAARAYQGTQLGSTLQFGGTSWKVVGIFDAGGTAFDSEIWCDATLLNQAFQRPAQIFQSVTVRLTSPEAFASFKDALTTDPRLRVLVYREVDYYRKNSEFVTRMIEVLGTLVAFAMGVGAVFAGLNTMYSALSARVREVAVLRALGFGTASVFTAFLLEALLIAALGGLAGSLLVLPLNGWTTSTINWQTFSHLSFAFRVTPSLVLQGLLFALGIGFLGGLPPAWRAARGSVVRALREL
ncbi:MAG: ABC transporter permease [Acidobacteria bacterium]|nr:ABC transporter permease [Acidobacteriota bacterium]MDW7985059.1 ABC transporter permease [Acidobacteriota bacterium]